MTTPAPNPTAEQMPIATPWDHRIIDTVSIALGGTVGTADDLDRFRAQIEQGPSPDKLRAACEVALAFIRWSQDLKAERKAADAAKDKQLAEQAERIGELEAERDAWKHEWHRTITSLGKQFGDSPDDATKKCAERVFDVLNKWQDRQRLSGRKMMVELPLDSEPIATVIQQHMLAALATLTSQVRTLRDRVIECERFLEEIGIQDVLDYPCPDRPDYAQVVDRACGWCGSSQRDDGTIRHNPACILAASEALGDAK